MIVTPVPHGLDLLPLSVGRSTGLHISDIYTRLYQALEPKRYKADAGPNVVKMAVGVAWENHVERCIEAAGIIAERPREQVTIEGIAFSPDLLLVDEQGETRIGEQKATWMVATDSLDHQKFDKWMTQVKAYCRALGIPRARFYVLFINGQGTRTRHNDPELRAYDITFTERELADNWGMLLNYARSEGML